MELKSFKSWLNESSKTRLTGTLGATGKEMTQKEIEKLILSFIDDVQNVVEISIAMYADEIKNEKGSKGIQKALKYVFDKYKEHQAFLSDDMLTIVIKTAFFKSLKQYGFEDKGYKKTILKDIEKFKLFEKASIAL